MVALDLEPAARLALAAHEHPEVRQLVHRADRKPAAPLEELPTFVGERRPVVDGVAGDPAVEHQVVRARDHDERVELQVLHLPHGGARSGKAAPAAPRPEATTAHDVSARGESRDLDGHPAIVAETTVRLWQVQPRV